MMMQEITFTTRGGANIRLYIQSEEWIGKDDWAGKPITKACYDLRVSVDGKNLICGGLDLIDHPEHGAVLKPYFGPQMIRVPSEAQQAVADFLAAYKTEIWRRNHPAAPVTDAERETARLRYKADDYEADMHRR